MKQEKQAFNDEPTATQDPSTTGEAHDIPTLDAVVPGNANAEESAQELNVSLGYAEPADNLSEEDEDLEAIQTLPLDSMVIESPSDIKQREREIATLEAIVFDGVDPEVAKNHIDDVPTLEPLQNIHSEAESASATSQPAETEENKPKINIPPHIAAHSSPKPLPKTSSNPFLPQHILDRLNQGRRNLVEEIAASGAALDASTAMLRARTHTERERHAKAQQHHEAPNGSPSHSQDLETAQTQILIDEIVDEYLPLLASELRKRLKAVLDKRET